jgi:hypothetical protein
MIRTRVHWSTSWTNPAATWRVAVCCALIEVLVLLCAPTAAQQGNATGDEPVCGHALQGFVRLKDGPPLRHAVVEEVLEPHLTIVLRTVTDGSGRFQLPYGRRKRGSHVLLRISSPGVATTLVKIRIDPTCRDPLITLPAGSASPGGGVR